MDRCINCGSHMIYPSKTRSKWEKLRKQYTSKRPFRCHCCEWRGWGIELGPKFVSDDLALASQVLAPKAPDLDNVKTPAFKTHANDLALSLLDE